MTTPEPSPADTAAPADMTEPDTDEVTPDTPDDGPPAAEESEPDSEPSGPDREAARHSTPTPGRLSRSENTLSAQLAEMQRGQVETLIGNRLYSPADFWKFGPELPELLTDGAVDPAKVDAARAEIVRSAPYLAPSVAAPASMVTATGVPTGEQSKPVVDPRNPFRRARGLPEIEPDETSPPLGR